MIKVQKRNRPTRMPRTTTLFDGKSIQIAKHIVLAEMSVVFALAFILSNRRLRRSMLRRCIAYHLNQISEFF